MAKNGFLGRSYCGAFCLITPEPRPAIKNELECCARATGCLICDSQELRCALMRGGEEVSTKLGFRLFLPP